MGAVPLPLSTTTRCGGIRSGKGGSHGKRLRLEDRGNQAGARTPAAGTEVKIAIDLSRTKWVYCVRWGGTGATPADDASRSRACGGLGGAVPGMPGAPRLRGVWVRLRDRVVGPGAADRRDRRNSRAVDAHVDGTEPGDGGGDGPLHRLLAGVGGAATHCWSPVNPSLVDTLEDGVPQGEWMRSRSVPRSGGRGRPAERIEAGGAEGTASVRAGGITLALRRTHLRTAGAEPRAARRGPTVKLRRTVQRAGRPAPRAGAATKA
jgi:hypothetical protein